MVVVVVVVVVVVSFESLLSPHLWPSSHVGCMNQPAFQFLGSEVFALMTSVFMHDREAQL